MIREYRQYTLDEVCNFLLDKKNTLIIFHVRPDADAIGAAFALKLVLEAMGSKTICTCESEIPSRLAFLTDKHQRSARFENMDRSFEFQRVVTIDTASPSQLGNLQKLFEDKIDLMIDHHENGIKYADYYIRSDYAASGEIIYEIASRLVEMGKLDEIPRDAYDLIYAALSSDTGCFKYSNVSAHTHLCAAELIGAGVDTAEINHRLFDCKSEKMLAAEAAGIQNIKFFSNRKIAAIMFPYDLKQKLELDDEHLETLVDVARAVDGVKIAISTRQATEYRSFRISLRSSCSFDVSVIAKHFGGGGHTKAAACTIEADSIEFATQLVIDEIMKLWGKN
jgi:phosphoesterase RecJ-like protein